MCLDDFLHEDSFQCLNVKMISTVDFDLLIFTFAIPCFLINMKKMHNELISELFYKLMLMFHTWFSSQS